jgi:hypothetical protein
VPLGRGAEPEMASPPIARTADRLPVSKPASRFMAGCAEHDRAGFAIDPPLEGNGFEPSVPVGTAFPAEMPMMRWFGPYAERDGFEPSIPPTDPLPFRE